MTTEELQRLSNLDWVAEQPDSANGWWVVDGADDSGDGGMYEATARDVASVPALARELIAARRVVEAARQAARWDDEDQSNAMGMADIKLTLSAYEKAKA